MRVDEKTVAMWFARIEEDSDLVAGLREVVENEKYELEYRFRYYKDDKIFGSDDVKNWYKGTVAGTRNYALIGCRESFRLLTEAAGHRLYEVLNEGDLEAMLKKMEQIPMVHMKLATKEEAAAYEKEEQSR